MARDHRHSVSRRMAIYLQASFYERQQQRDGSIPCAYCWTPLDPSNRCLDHINNNPDDNRPENVVAACLDCNKALGRHNQRGRDLLDFRLEDLGIDPAVSRAGVERIRATPLRFRDDPEVVAVAVAWFGDRIMYERHVAAEYRRAHGGLLAPRHAHHARAARHNVDVDQEVPF